MTGRWFRFYDEALDDPKVQRLSAEDFRSWVNLLCIASRNDGKLPPLSDIAFALRTDENGARTVLERLSNGGGNGGLIDRLNGGANGYHYAPHSWNKRQYKSDTSTDRVKRFRQRSETVAETPPETETETELTVAKATVSRERSKLAEQPSDVSDSVWGDFKRLRKDKRASLTITALDQIRKQAVEVGWTLEAALTECCARGWQSFKADWINQGNGRNGQRNGSNGASIPGLGRTGSASVSVFGTPAGYSAGSEAETLRRIGPSRSAGEPKASFDG